MRTPERRGTSLGNGPERAALLPYPAITNREAQQRRSRNMRMLLAAFLTAGTLLGLAGPTIAAQRPVIEGRSVSAIVPAYYYYQHRRYEHRRWDEHHHRWHYY
jgi:hypothetical protein